MRLYRLIADRWRIAMGLLHLVFLIGVRVFGLAQVLRPLEIRFYVIFRHVSQGP